LGPGVVTITSSLEGDETMAPHIDHSKYSQLYPNMPDDNYLKPSSIRLVLLNLRKI
jgi:hypothetical protein